MHDDTHPRPDPIVTETPPAAESESSRAVSTGAVATGVASEKLPLELLRSRRRELLAELRDVDAKIRALEEKTEQPPQRERVAIHVTEVLEDQHQASASDLVRAVLRRDSRLHAGTVRAYISSLRRDGRLRAVGGRGVPGDPLVLALPEARPDGGQVNTSGQATVPGAVAVASSTVAVNAK